jgi:hypothetical protein
MELVYIDPSFVVVSAIVVFVLWLFCFLRGGAELLEMAERHTDRRLLAGSTKARHIAIDRCADMTK